MRTAKMAVNGQEHLLCFSARVVRACTERYGGVERITDVLSDQDTVKVLDESLWILAAMMDAGDRYAKLNGLENPPPLSCDALYDAMGMEDFAGLQGKIAETIRSGRETHVEVEPGKNGEATQG